MRLLRLIPIACLGLCACATGAPSNTRPVTETSRVTSGSQIGIEVMRTTITHSVDVSAPISLVWNALPAVFDSVGIKVADVDPASYQIGNRGFAVGRQLGGVMTSRFFDCGSNGGASNAFSWDLFVSVVTTATAVMPGTTSLGTVVEVKGRPVSTSGNWLPCATTGALEKKISDVLLRSLSR